MFRYIFDCNRQYRTVRFINPYYQILNDRAIVAGVQTCLYLRIVLRTAAQTGSPNPVETSAVEMTMNKLIFASILTTTISISASYADTVKADKAVKTTETVAVKPETVAMKPETVDRKTVSPDPAPVVKSPSYPKGLKDLGYLSDFPINAY